MNYLEKVANYGTRLEKIAAIVDELTVARDEYEAEAVLAFGEEMGIPVEEVEQAIPLFKEASAASYDPTEELVKVAMEVVDDPYATSLEKVAAMVDGVVAGAFDPEAAYEAAAELGFAPDDVDFIYETAYLDKEAANKKTEDKEESLGKKLLGKAKNAYTFADIRSGLSGDKKDWGKVAKGAGKSGLAYGAPIAAAAGGYEYYKNRKDNK